MNVGFALSFLATVVSVSWLASAVVGASMAAGGRALIDSLAPRARSRVLFALVLAPAFVAFCFVLAVTLDSHLPRVACRANRCDIRFNAWPPAFPLLLVAAFLIRLGWIGVRSVNDLFRIHSLKRQLDLVCDRAGERARLLPGDERQAFTLGIWSPCVYVSRDVLSAAPASEARSVLEHEYAHVRRRDPMQRWLAVAVSPFHLPWLATPLLRRCSRAQELAADAEAAEAVGDACQVAAALVRYARASARHDTTALAVQFIGDLDERVRELLRTDARPDRPAAAWLVATALLALTGALWAAHSVHAGAEALLAFLIG